VRYPVETSNLSQKDAGPKNRRSSLDKANAGDTADGLHHPVVSQVILEFSEL